MRPCHALIAFAFTAAAAGSARAQQASSTPAKESIIIVVSESAGDTAAAAAQHMADQLEAAVEIRTSTEALELAAQLQHARAGSTARFMIVLDTERARVTVLRPADGTMLSRPLDSSTVEESPYAVSVTALELLEVAKEMPGGSVIVEDQPGSISFGITLSAAFSLIAAPGHEAALAQPMLSAGLVLRPPASAWWGSIGARARLIGDSDVETGGIPDVSFVDYERNDVALRLAIGHTDRSAELSAGVELGVSFTHLFAFGTTGTVLDDTRRVSPWAGAGVELRYAIGAGFAVGLGAGTSFVFEPARYSVRNTYVIEEGRIRLHGDAGLSWAWR